MGRLFPVADTSGIAAQARGLHGRNIGLPAVVVLDAKLAKIPPGKNAGIVKIVEIDPDSVVAHWLHVGDTDMAAAGDQHPLPGPVALNFCRRTFDAQIFCRQRIRGTVVKRNI